MLMRTYCGRCRAGGHESFAGGGLPDAGRYGRRGRPDQVFQPRPRRRRCGSAAGRRPSARLPPRGVAGRGAARRRAALARAGSARRSRTRAGSAVSPASGLCCSLDRLLDLRLGAGRRPRRADRGLDQLGLGLLLALGLALAGLGQRALGLGGGLARPGRRSRRPCRRCWRPRPRRRPPRRPRRSAGLLTRAGTGHGGRGVRRPDRARRSWRRGGGV